MNQYTAKIAFCVLAALVGCSAGDSELALPVADVERARELQLVVVPPVNRITSEAFADQTERGADDESITALRDVYGRLGFFPRTSDLRSAARSTAGLYAAFYRWDSKNITVIGGDPTAETLVHELTHALQDQHFDITRFFSTLRSSDEVLAGRALVEGDAVLTTYRYSAWAAGVDPVRAAALNVTPDVARAGGERLLASTEGPLFFVAVPSFAYTLGATYAASLLRVRAGLWSYAELNEKLAEHGPASTQEVIRGGVDVDPIEPVGLAALPEDIAADHKVVGVDRIGEYYTYVLLHPIVSASALQELTSNWDGDQLVYLEKSAGGSAIAWTSIWETEDAATKIAQALVALHTGGGPLVATTYAYVTTDGEEMWIEQRGRKVCLLKNVDTARMERLADVALSTGEEKRLAIRRPRIVVPVEP